jgi:hypothetical protein
VSDNPHEREVHLEYGEEPLPPLTAAGGWCAPSETLYDLMPPLVSVSRGGIVFPSAEEVAEQQAKRRQWEHDNRWELRRATTKSWLLLRPVRRRIHDHIHRRCDPW